MLVQSVVVVELSLVVAEADAMTTMTVIAMSRVGVEVRVIVVGSCVGRSGSSAFPTPPQPAGLPRMPGRYWGVRSPVLRFGLGWGILSFSRGDGGRK